MVRRKNEKKVSRCVKKTADFFEVRRFFKFMPF